MRIGLGYDVHRLTEKRKLILGGVEVTFEKGLLGHSDADVLVHAIGDALLGAAAFGDLGVHFPPEDNKYKDISSLTLLQKIQQLLQHDGYEIVNIDATIVAEKPKLKFYIKQMRQNIADALKLDFTLISVKATTTEGLGFAGIEEGMAAYAICLIEKEK